jgi:hypothetical protein
MRQQTNTSRREMLCPHLVAACIFTGPPKWREIPLIANRLFELRNRPGEVT